MSKGLNLQDVRNENRALILYLLNNEGTLSRKEIAARLSLTPAAVTKICSELISRGLIEESGSVSEKKSGRREILLSLRLDEMLGLGINAESDCVTLSVFTLGGELLKISQIPLYSDADRVIDEANRFLLESGYEKERFAGAGVCIVGSVNEDDFGIWKDKDLAESFEEKLRIPVVTENNVKAFALSEIIYGASKNSRNVLFLKWGPGVGSAIVANGKVYTGNDASVTEIGHYIVNKGGKKCRCGRFGCLETEVSMSAIKNELSSKQSLNELLKNGDVSAINILEHKIDTVALALANTATIMNADSIVFFGTMFNNDFVAEALKKQCLRYNSNLSERAVTLSPLNEKSSYIGAAALCAKHFFFERNV